MATDAVGILLLASALAKMRARHEFERVLRGYGIVPRNTARPLAMLVVGCEIGVGVSLFMPDLRSVAAATASAVFAVMALAVGASLALGKVPEHCGCFGEGGRAPDWWTVARTLGLAAVAITLSPLPTAVGSTLWIAHAAAMTSALIVVTTSATLRASSITEFTAQGGAGWTSKDG